jgi:hypothetical protein
VLKNAHGEKRKDMDILEKEFGKIILLVDSKRVMNNTKRKVIYADEFTDHDKKFQAVFEYLQKNGHEECLMPNAQRFFSGFLKQISQRVVGRFRSTTFDILF